MAKIVKALRSLNVNTKLITDIDVLNDETVFQGIVESYGIDYDAIRTDYKNIVSNLHSDKEKINRIAAKSAISQIMDNGKSAELSKNELKQIRDVISTTSIWSKLKSSGVSALPSGNATASFKHMEQVLQGNGIYIIRISL